MQTPISEGFRLSSQQRRVWLSQQDSPAYRAQCAVVIEGNLQSDILRQSLKKVVDRHEILRTTFHLRPGMRVPLQVIADHGAISCHNVDLTMSQPDEQEVKIKNLFEEYQRSPLDFEQGPLLHLSLVALTAQKHVLLVGLPALCADALSLKNLVREISRSYAECLGGEEESISPLQYMDFCAWQEQMLAKENEDASSGEEYWRKHEFATDALITLPFENKRAAPTDFTLRSFALEISAEISARIEDAVKEYATSPANVLLACWQTLCWRLTGQSDVTVGTVFDGRKFEDLTDVLGLFARSLPIRCHFDGDPRFGEILRQVGTATRDAEEWQDYFTRERLVGEGNNDGCASFPIGFEFADWRSKYEAAGVSFSLYTQHVCFDRFKVKLCCVRTGDSLTAELQYDSNMFSADDMERLGRQFQTLLGSVADDLETPISRLNILSDSEKHQVLVEFNDTRADYRKDKCIHRLFEAQAERTPDKVAVVFEDRQLTYGELNARSNQLAHHLRGLGVGPEVTVALCVERSLEMVIGLLGVLKAGGAYVPLDPVLPKERLARMVKDARPPVLLTQQRLVEGIPDFAGQVVCLDTDWNAIVRRSTENPVGEANSKNLAYVLFTSGSTGRPKGVAVEHRQLVNYLDGILRRLDLPEGASFATVSTLAADLGNTAIFPSLCNGGCLHVIAQERAMDPDALAEYFARHPIDCLKIVPSHLEALLNSSAPERVLPRKRLVLGGEVCGWALAEKVQALAPDCIILNHYGPTETTVGVTTCRVAKGQTASRSTTVPIGRPLANTEIYLLDGHMQPVPIWVAGELHISGDGVARGYLNDLELTAEKFIAHPFSDDSMARLYKTGDLCRYLPDGNIEFLGRMDDQVKIRGFRIELGEIEVTLREHAAVRECVVVGREDSSGAKQLAAYVVARREQSPTATDLRNFLKATLPDYMVPSAIVFLDTLPLTPNGKVARQALPPPDQTRREVENAFVTPRTPVEEAVAGVWKEILKIERLGIHDNFFELGGHSLLATQVISRLHGTFHIGLPLRSLFESPTVAALAERIEEVRRQEQSHPTLPILPVSRDRDLPLSFAQQRLWFLDQLEPGSTTYNMSRAVRLTGPLNVAALEKSVSEILRRHEALRTTFGNVDGQPFQRVSPAQPLSLSVIDLVHLPQAEREAEVQRLAKAEGHRPFDLTHGPLLRASLLRLGEEHHVFLYSIHHIASDGWSMRIFNKEIGSLYRTFSTGQPSLFHELSIQYPDFAHWQRQWLQGEVLENQLSYWKKQLGGISVLQLPTDRPRPAVQSFHGARQSLILSKSLTEALKGLSRQEGVTLFMILLAAFKVLLFRYTGQEDIVVGTPIAGRNRAEIEPLIGFFINTLALRTDLSGNPSFQELLSRVREVALGAYAHQEFPFEKLVEELQPERDLSRTPLFQVFFNMVNLESHRPELGDLTVEHLLLSEPDPKFDLTFYAKESNEEIHLTLVYNADLFCQDRMVETLHQFRYLLDQIVESIESSIRSYSLVTPSSAHLLPDPAAVLPEPHHESVTSLFVACAKQSPSQIAVMQGIHAWNYKQLSVNADTLARVLVAYKTRPGDVVVVTGPKSFGLVSSMVAVLQCGGVLCSVDPNLPATRQLLMLRESGAKHLLYIGAWRKEDEWMRELSQVDILFVSQDEGRFLQGERIPNLEAVQLPQISENDAAYVFFTSGTTGVPKAVLGSHKGLSHFLTWQKETFAVGPEDRCAQLTSLSFDVVLRDVFLPLISGATLCLPNAIEEATSDGVLQWLDDKKMTLLHTVPSLAQSWLSRLPGRATLHSLKWVFLAGEPLTDSLVRQWREAFPDSGEIVNLYGPTETTLAKCFYTVPAEIPSAVQPLGKPLPQTQALVLAENRQLCGIGEPGEIALRTPFRTFGYINAPEEQRKRFITNPYGGGMLDLIYLTGDRGRYLPDGLLEILGRLDDQVKIRGVRVEPEEVTAILSRHPLVRCCIVVARTNDEKESILVAYVVASAGNQLKIAELRSYLRKALPSAAVPSAFVMLNALPLTPNGKVDRQALPAPSRNGPELEEAFVTPRTPTEKLLAGVWAEILKLERVGVHDNFFDLGGHSLLAAQVISRVRQAFHVELPLRSLFETPTVGSLAVRIVETQAKNVVSKEMTDVLAILESLSDEQAERLLAQKSSET